MSLLLLITNLKSETLIDKQGLKCSKNIVSKLLFYSCLTSATLVSVNQNSFIH